MTDRGRRTLGIALLATGAAVLLAATLSHAWWRMNAHDGSGGLGLRDLVVCDREGCTTKAYAEIPGMSAVFVDAGAIAYWLAIIAAGAAAVAVALAFGQRAVRGPVSPARLCAGLMLVEVVALVVFVLYSRVGGPDVSLGFAAPLALIGVSAAIAGSAILAGFDRARA